MVFDPLPESEFDAYKAAHLLWRAGFGCTWAEAEKLAAKGLESAVATLVDLPPLKLAQPPAAELPKLPRREFEESLRLLEEDQQREARRKRDQQERGDIGDLKFWWLLRMLESSPDNPTCRPLEEKMALFWHSHFASSFEGKIESTHPMWRQNQTFRELALAPFPEIMRAVIRDPAMLIWLDNASSRVGRPNENFARELMELFSTGVNQYTEHDVKEAARALTGWGVDRDTWTFRLDAEAHDEGEKTLFGKPGNWSGDELVDIICHHKATADFLSAKLLDYFLAHPAPERVRKIAAQIYRASGYDHRELLRRLFLSREFYAEHSRGVVVKSAVVLAVGALKQLLVTNPPQNVLLDSLRLMGQDLFFPPDVNGWPGGAAWINSNTLLIRYNFANFLMNGVSPDEFKVFSRDEAPPAMKRRDFVESQRNPLAIDWSPRRQIKEAGLERRLSSGRFIVDHYVREFLQRPVPKQLGEQLNRFAETDAAGGRRTFSLNDSNFDERVRGLVHLIMSSPDYQLC